MQVREIFVFCQKHVTYTSTCLLLQRTNKYKSNLQRVSRRRKMKKTWGVILSGHRWDKKKPLQGIWTPIVNYEITIGKTSYRKLQGKMTFYRVHNPYRRVVLFFCPTDGNGRQIGTPYYRYYILLTAICSIFRLFLHISKKIFDF